MHLRLLLLISLALTLSACGARENPALLTQGDADALLARIDEAESAASDERCNDARRALRDGSQQVGALDAEVSQRLRRNLEDWLEQARKGLDDACEEEPEETPTPDETEEPEPTPTPTAEPTDTPSPEPTDTPTPVPTENPGNGTGGSDPGEEDDG